MQGHKADVRVVGDSITGSHAASHAQYGFWITTPITVACDRHSSSTCCKAATAQGARSLGGEGTAHRSPPLRGPGLAGARCCALFPQQGSAVNKVHFFK